MRNALIAAFLASTAASPAVAQQIPVNSLPLHVSNFAYPVGQGDWANYEAWGFYQPPGSGNAQIKPRLYLLPLLTVPKQNVRFINANGQTYRPDDCATQPAKRIVVDVKMSAALPNEMQTVAVGAALSSSSADGFLAPWPTTPTGQPVMYGPATTMPDAVMAIQSMYNAHKAETEKQAAFAKRYADYTAAIAVLNELRLDLSVDGDSMAETLLPGSTVAANSAPVSLVIRDPDTYTCNRMLENGFQVMAHYRFSDTATALVNAEFDAARSLQHFVTETRKAITKSRSSGWQVFHIGSRRSRMKTSVEESMKVRDSIQEMRNTNIVMFDATDDMVKRFEDTFFPELSRQEAIEGHLAAARDAEAAGKPDLAEVHRKYAEALQAGNKLAEVDAVGAAAALNEGDYATFIAKGVRASSTNDVSANSFRRIVDVNVEIEKVTRWNESKTITVQRETSSPVRIEAATAFRGALGVYSGMPFTFNFVSGGSPYSPPNVTTRQGFFLAGLHPTGSFATAGLMPGMIVTSINGYTPTSLQDFNDLDRKSVV